MKTYFKSRELPHQWAHQLSPHGRCPGNESFNGTAYLSYGTEIGRIIEHKGKKAYLLNITSYSHTTGGHQNALRRAIPKDAIVFEIGGIGRGCSLYNSGRDLGVRLFDYAIEQAAESAGKAERARTYKDAHLARQAYWLEKAKVVNEFFGLRRKVDDNVMNRLKDRIDAERRRQLKADRERQARIEKENLEQIEAWLKNESDHFPYNVSRVYLRKLTVASAGCAVAFRMETSRGVTVPIEDAERTFRFIVTRRNKGWRRNGEQFAIGEFQLDSVSEHGVIAGCHHVDWDEIERFAKLQGWA